MLNPVKESELTYMQLSCGQGTIFAGNNGKDHVLGQLYSVVNKIVVDTFIFITKGI